MPDERPGRGHLPQLRAGGPARAGRPRRRRRPQADQRRRRQRARHRGDRDLHLQPGRDLHRGRPVPRQRRVALAAARRARRRDHRGDAAAPLRPLRRRRRLPPVPGRRRARLDGRRRGPDPRPDPRGAAPAARRSAPSVRPSTCCSSRRCGSASAPAPRPASTRSRRRWSAPRSTAPTRPSAPSRGKYVVVVGAGAMAGLATATVARLGAAEVRGRQPHRRTGPTASPRSTAPARSPSRTCRAELGAADILITCTGASGTLISRDMLAESARPATGRSSVIDIALPHDVDPAVAVAARGHPDRPGPARRARCTTTEAGREVARGAPDRRRGGHRVPRRPAPGERHPDRGRAPLDGDRGRRRRDGPARGPAARPRRRRPAPRSGTPCAGSPTSCSTSPRSGSRSSPTSRAPSPTPPRSPSCSRSTPRPSTRSPRPEGLALTRAPSGSAPAAPCSPRPRPSRWPRSSATGSAVRPSWSRSPPRATCSQDAGTAARRIQHHRRVRQRPARGAARRPDRRGRALAQGPPDLPRRRHRAGRGAAARGSRATSSSPATASPSASSRPAAASAPARPGGRPSCTPSASVWTWSPFVATSTPGSARSGRGSMTPSCWRGPGWPGSVGWTR